MAPPHLPPLFCRHRPGRGRAAAGCRGGRRRPGSRRAIRCPSRSTSCATWRRRWQGSPMRRRRWCGRGAAQVDRLRPAQPDHLPQGRDALGRRAGGGEGALLPSGALLQGAGRDQRRGGGGRRGELLFSTDLFDMPEGHPARRTRECRLRRVRGDGPGGEERLDGGARGVLLPDVWLPGAVRDVGAGARYQLGRAGCRRSSRASPASGWKRRRRAGSSSTRCSRARGRPGAYRMATAHDKGVFQDIEATLFLRGDDRPIGNCAADVDVLVREEQPFRRAGLAAGDPRQRRAGDGGSRPASGSGGRLNDPPRVMANSFRADGLKGFGLAQRERSFEEYQDDGVFYEKRATVWVTPQGDWGGGGGDAGRALDERRDPRQHRRVLEPGRAGGRRQPLRSSLRARLGGGLAAAVGGALHRHSDQGGRCAGAAATGEPGEVRLRPRRQGAGGDGPLRAGWRRWSGRAAAA